MELDSQGKIEEIESQNVLAVEQGNGAVLLDISQIHSQAGGRALKLTKNGHVSEPNESNISASFSYVEVLQTVLVPQPSDDQNDPLNWSQLKKNLLLLSISLAAFQSDFQTAVGVPGVVLQGAEWQLTPIHVNYAGNLNVLMKYVVYFCSRA